MILVQYALPSIHQTQRLRMAVEEGHEMDLQELLSLPINPDSVAKVAQSFECSRLVVVVDDIMVVAFYKGKHQKTSDRGMSNNELPLVLNPIHQLQTFIIFHMILEYS